MPIPSEPPPFRAEPMDVAQARYPQALIRLWPNLQYGEVPDDIPIAHPEHVFDFSDGLRLVVCRMEKKIELDQDWHEIFIIGMAHKQYAGMTKGRVNETRLGADDVLDRFAELSGRIGVEVQVTCGGITNEGRMAWWKVRE